MKGKGRNLLVTYITSSAQIEVKIKTYYNSLTNEGGKITTRQTKLSLNAK